MAELETMPNDVFIRETKHLIKQWARADMDAKTLKAIVKRHLAEYERRLKKGYIK